MKIRNGFVSNSSSSSFVCSVCGAAEEIYDGESEHIATCVCGHEWHISCVNDRTVLSKQRILVLDHVWLAELDDDRARLISCGDTTAINKAFDEYCMYRDNYYMPETLCPVCNLEFVPGRSLSKYLLKKFDISEDDIEDEIRNKFKSFKELSEYLKK